MNSNTIHASNIVTAIMGKWLGGLPVNVVANVSDLPVDAPPDARGMYRKDATWIVAETQPGWQVAHTLAHEMLGHHGMRQALGAKWRPFMHAIQSGLRSGDRRLQVARGMVRSAYVDDAGAFNLSAVSESDEIAALVAELGFDPEKGKLSIQQPTRKVAAATAGQFARETLYLDRPATFEELEGALLTAEHQLRHGGPIWGLGFKFRRWYAATMTKPWDPNKPPMSLAQSEFLLREEVDQQQAKSDRKGLYLVLQLVLAALLLGAGILGFFWNVGATVGLFR